MKNENEKDYQLKAPIKAITLIIVFFIMLVMIAYGVLAFVFPKTLAEITYNLNMYSYSSTLYYRDYQSTNDINSLYKCVNISNKAKEYNKVIDYSEDLFKHKDYEKFIEFIDKDYKKQDIDVLIKSSVLDENEYLKNQYIFALVQQNEYDKIDKAIEQYTNYTITLTESGDYYYTNLIQSSNQKLIGIFDDNAYEKYNEIKDYYDQMLTLFKDNCITGQPEYMVNLGNKIIKVGLDLIKLNNNFKLDGNSTLENDLRQVNLNIKEVINEN